jgi:hypothetical protein
MARQPPVPLIFLRIERVRRGWSFPRMAQEIEWLHYKLGRGKITVDPAMICKWEKGYRSVSPFYAELLVRLFDKPADELGLVPVAELATWPYYGAMPGGMGVDRRIFLEHMSALGVTGVAGQDFLERIAAAVDKPAVLDPQLLDNLGQLTAIYRSLDRKIGSPNVLGDVVFHLARLNRLTQRPQPSDMQARLVGIISDTAQFMGWIMIDLRDFATSKALSRYAARAAHEANDAGLLAYAIGSTSYADIYDGKGDKAISVLTGFQGQLDDRLTPAVRAWLAAATAEAHALLGNVEGFQRAIDEAETLLASAGHAEEPAWISFFDPLYLTRLKGRCLVELALPQPAQDTLGSVLTILGEDTSFVRTRGSTLADLAVTYIHQKEPEEAARHGEQALKIAQQLGSTRNLTRIQHIGHQLQPWATNPTVRHFREQLLLTP